MLSCWQQSRINDPYDVAVSTFSIYDLGIRKCYHRCFKWWYKKHWLHGSILGRWWWWPHGKDSTAKIFWGNTATICQLQIATQLEKLPMKILTIDEDDGRGRWWKVERVKIKNCWKNWKVIMLTLVFYKFKKISTLFIKGASNSDVEVLIQFEAVFLLTITYKLEIWSLGQYDFGIFRIKPQN